MRAWMILWVVLLPQDPSDQVRALVEKLGSDEIAAREQAAAELVKLGPAAIPAMRAQLAKTDGERRARLEAVVKKIERDDKVAKLLAPGPTVTLKAKDRPAAEVIAEIQKQTGIPIDGRDIPAGTLLSIDAVDLPITKALDGLCRSHGGLRPSWMLSGVQLVRGTYRPGPSCESGPFSFVLESLPFTNPSEGRASFAMIGYLIGPPGRLPETAWVDVEKMEDDQGTDLGQSTPPRNSNKATNHRTIWTQVPEENRVAIGSIWQIPRLPAEGATRVKLCRGQVRMSFALEIHAVVTVKEPTQLAAAPVSASAGGRSVRIVRFAKEGDNLRFGYVVTRTEEAAPPAGYWASYRPQQLVLQDAAGHRLTGRFGKEGSMLRDDGTTRQYEFDGEVEFTLPKDFKPAELILLESTDRVDLTFPFEFRDIRFR